MGVRHRLSPRAPVVALAVATLLVGAGCKRKEESVARTAPSHRAADALAPGELPEGSLDVLGLRLPIGARIVTKLGTATIVRSSAVPTQLDGFVGKRVEGESTMQDGARVWTAAKVKAGKDPEQRVRIEISRSKDPDFKSEIFIDPLAKNPLPATATTEERWRAVGVTPDGTLINKNRE